MYKDIDFIYNAFSSFEQLTGFSVTVESKGEERGAVATINGHIFFVIAKNEIRKENESLLINLVVPFEEKYCQNLCIAKYISNDTSKTLKALRINYLDISGNCYIQAKDFFIHVSGQKVQRKSKTNQAKVFQESGIKLLFQLLSKPDHLQLSYRELAEMANISVGSVSNILTQLAEERFILKTKTKRLLKNTPELLERWVIAYHDVLRSRLMKKRMRFSNKGISSNWKSLQLSGKGLWGSEAGASILTNQINPESFTIYTFKTWQSIGEAFGLIPDENGNVEILQQFWIEDSKNEEKQIVPPLLIYADLMQSGFGRNAETAQLILENELSYLK